MRKGMWAGLLVAGVMLWMEAVGAQEASRPWEEYDKLIKSAEVVGAHGNDLFGEQVNLYNGALSFSVTDVSLPGKLPVALTRTFTVSNRKGYQFRDAPLADWDLDLPRLSGVFASDWVSSASGTPGKRCSVTTIGAATPPTVTVGETIFLADDYWHGNHLSLPGGGGGEMLLVKAGVGKPTTGGPYYWVTSGLTYFSCLPGIQAGGTGEGFLAITPDGTKYWFNRMAKYYEPSLKGAKPTDGQIARRKNVLYATRVEDRFGNWVTYTFDNAPNAPAKLTGIAANDGREITLGYNAQGHLSTVNVGGNRTWTYVYAYPTASTGTLTDVVLPDTRRWTIDFAALSSALIRYYHGAPGESWRDCFDPGALASPAQYTGTITHPSGAVGEFTVAPLRHGRSNVPASCSNYTVTGNNPNDDVAYYSIAYDAFSLTRKRLSGPGLAALEWTYEYQPTITWFLPPGGGGHPVCATADCSAPQCVNDDCAGIAETAIFGPGPNGDYLRYTFGNSYRYNEGKLLKVERGTGPNGILRTETTAYQLSAAGQPYPATIGTSPQPRGDAYTTEALLPLKRRTIAQSGATFDSLVNTYDAYANPVSVTRASSLGYSATDTTSYHHNTALWVLSQVATQATGGVQSARTHYDPTTALPLEVYAFGKLQQTLTYHADGTLKTVSDGRDTASFDTTVTFPLTLPNGQPNWKRGIPQLIRHPPTPDQPTGTTESAVVDNNGWITSVTDENGYTTVYDYDDMGRLTLVDYPDEDDLTWNSTTLSFAPHTVGPKYGIPAGHWQQTVSTGNARKVTYFDALWRPLVEESYDSADEANTRSVIVKRYDSSGHLAFQSYPLRNLTNYATVTTGTSTYYDALDRPTLLRQTSELGNLDTTTQYLSGFKTRLTLPKHQSANPGVYTETTYQAWDQPTTEFPVYIDAPEGVTTTISRDAFGKPLQVTRSGPDG